MSQPQPVPLKLALRNTPDIELWPANTLRARSNAHARLLARAQWVLRRKRDGAYLAAVVDGTSHALVPHLMREPGLHAAMTALRAQPMHARNGLEHVGSLPLHRLHERLQWLGLDAENYSAQVGLSGKSVTPRIYLAFGISGAVQHVAGMSGAETVIAVNTDPEAPIFRVADLGIQGDAMEVLNAVIEAVKARKQQA